MKLTDLPDRKLSPEEARPLLAEIERAAQEYRDEFDAIVRQHPFINDADADAINNHVLRQIEIAESVGKIKERLAAHGLAV